MICPLNRFSSVKRVVMVRMARYERFANNLQITILTRFRLFANRVVMIRMARNERAVMVRMARYEVKNLSVNFFCQMLVLDLNE